MKINKFKLDHRSKKYLFQIRDSMLIKIFAILISYLSIPLMVNYLGIEKYGIWSTLLTISAWVLFFDFGLSNGLRNHVAKALEKQDYNLANSYLSTTFIGLIAICSILFIGILIGSFFIDWEYIFNSNIIPDKELNIIILITIFFILLNMVLSVINQVNHALQKSQLVVLDQFLTNLFILISVYILSKTISSNLLVLASFYGISMLSSKIIMTFLLFKNNSYFKLNYQLFDRKKIAETFTLGLKFFMLQFTVMTIFTTDKFIITQLFGPTYVTSYDIAYKLFFGITILFGLIRTPLWSSVTRAYENKDYKWIKKSVIILNLLMLFVVVGVVGLIYTAPYIIKLWIGDEVLVSTSLLISIGIYTIIFNWIGIYSYVINGIGKVNLQLVMMVIGALINIPLSIYFGKYLDMGTSGVVLASALSLTLFAIVGPIQVYFLLKEKIC